MLQNITEEFLNILFFNLMLEIKNTEKLFSVFFLYFWEIIWVIYNNEENGAKNGRKKAL